MDRNAIQNRLDIVSYLPAIYQKEAARDSDPLRALLEIFESTVAGIEDTIDNLAEYFDPDTAPSGRHEEERDFLTWLGSWVALRIDEEWSAETEDEKDQHEQGKEKKKRFLIKNAAMLHQHRGTVSGLQYMIEAFYDVDIDIMEWAWPRGMEIGRASSIGLDTFIMDRHNADHSFTLIWRPSEADRGVEESPARWIKTRFMGEAQKKKCLTVIWRPTGTEPQDELIRKLQKIRHMIDMEKPVHTSCYIGIELPEGRPEKRPTLSRMVIGLESTISMCFIDQEGKNGI